MSQNEFSRLHRTIQFSISCHFLWRLIIYHRKFRLSSQFSIIFEIFISSLFLSIGTAELQRSETSYNIASKFCLSNWFSNFFSIFYQLVLHCGFQLTGVKTLSNISSFFVLSNQILTFFRFFISSLRTAAFQLTGCKTSFNISSDSVLSNHFYKKMRFFRKNSTENGWFGLKYMIFA